MNVNLNMHSLFYCFYNTFALKCFCSSEAILCNQEVACFVISVALAPPREGMALSGQTLDPPRKLAAGTLPEFQSAGGKVA